MARKTPVEFRGALYHVLDGVIGAKQSMETTKSRACRSASRPNHRFERLDGPGPVHGISEPRDPLPGNVRAASVEKMIGDRF